jgi:hypothetical protein
VLVATSALSLGIDYGHVRLVVHIDPPGDLVAFAQESGRAGRDGSTAKSVVLVTGRWQQQQQQQQQQKAGESVELYESRCAMAEYVRQPEQQGGDSLQCCRRSVLGRHLDGSSGVYCVTLPGAALCDVCSSGVAAAAMGSCPRESLDADVDVDVDADASAARWIEEEKDGTEQGGGTPALVGVAVSISAQKTKMSQADLDAFGRDLNSALVNLEGWCVLCWLDQQQHGRSSLTADSGQQHPYTSCPRLNSKCLKCLQPGHVSRSCRISLGLPSGVCFGCTLPRKIGNKTLHEESMGKQNC